MGSDEKYGVGHGRLSGKDSKNVNRETASLREVWAVVLPVPGGRDEGGRDRADSDINPPEAEHGRAIYCSAADYGPVQGGSKVSRNFYIAVTQQVLLFGAETWVLTKNMELAMDAFQGRIARTLTGRQPRRGRDE